MVKDAFISYSRLDQTFVRQLMERLIHQGYEPWIDWEEIPLSANWWQEIMAGIESVNAFIFVISPSSLKSQVCMNELNHAVKCSKRIIPLLCQDIADMRASVPEVLSELNWIFFDKEDQFDQSFNKLVKTLTEDVAYVREHTRLLMRAREWEQHGLHPDYLLHGMPLLEAQRWLEQSHRQPEPTDLHVRFIKAGTQVSQAISQKGRRIVRRIPYLLGMGQRKIFVSYRRADSQHITDRVYDRLVRHFRREDIFMDIASIDVGVNFADMIRRSLSDCAAALIVIGPQWASITDPQTDKRRLHNPEDFVRLEVEIALSNPTIRVMPLLVGGATMPQAQELPASLRLLGQRNATLVRHGQDFHKDMDYVVGQVREARRTMY